MADDLKTALRKAAKQMASAANPATFMGELGLQPDPWQVALLRSQAKQVLLLCSRQAGKSTTTAVLALREALYPPQGKPAMILILSPSQRQSKLLFRKVMDYYRQLGKPVAASSEQVFSLELENGSRIEALPDNEETVRGFSGVTLLIIDESASVSSALYKSVRPMLAASQGRLIALGTPRGKQGWYYEAWLAGNWERIRITADDCPRITKEFLDEERRSIGEMWYRQEYMCSFEQQQGLVYPELADCVIDPCEIKAARAFMGVDFGFHNPSAAIVGVLDTDDVLYLVEEIYGSRMTDEDLAQRIKPLMAKWNIEVLYCDSEAAGSIEKFRRADLPARKANKAVAAGIRAVSARLRSGRLKVFRTCANVIREAGLYRFPNADERALPTDNPIKDFDHSMDGLRYMVAGVDRVREIFGDQRSPIADATPAKEDYTKSVDQTRYGVPRPLTDAEAVPQRERADYADPRFQWESM